MNGAVIDLVDRQFPLFTGAMVTYQDIVKTIQELPLTERLSLLEMLAQSLQAEIRSKLARQSSLARVRGMLKVDGPLPSDQDLEEEYIEYLIEKYA